MKEIKKLAIAGCGGLGSFTTQFLFDYGANRNQYPWLSWQVDAYDLDAADTSNLLHQNFTMDDLGKNKAKIMAERYFVTPVERFMTVEDFPNYDVIFSCVDNMPFRKALYHYGFDHPELTWFDGRCSSRHICVFNSAIHRSVLEQELNDSTVSAGCLLAHDKENKVSHATPVIVAGILTQEFLNFLRGDINNSPFRQYI